MLAAFALAFALPPARAADAPPPTMTTNGTTASLYFAPDGQSLWSVGRDGELTIGTRDGRSVIFRGLLPRREGGGLQVLKDGSFLLGNAWGELQWFEPPQEGQPLKLRRAFDGPEAKAWQAARAWQRAEPMPTEMMKLGTGSRSFGALAVAPNERRVAYSFDILHHSGGAIFSGGAPKQETIRVWNLESGVIESEHIAKSDLFGPPKAEGSTSPSRAPWHGKPQLAWADAQTLVIARGLALERFDATTGEKASEWKPLDAPQALGRANVLGQDKYLVMSPAEMNILVKTALPFPFDAAKQRLLALSADGKQLIVCDGRKLVTLWNSETGEARILSENAAFVPVAAKFSPDGTRVAAWDGKMVRAWQADESRMAQALSGERRRIIMGLMTIPAREGAPVWDVALTGNRLAWAQKANEVWSLPLSSPGEIGRRPARLEDLKRYAVPVAK